MQIAVCLWPCIMTVRLCYLADWRTWRPSCFAVTASLASAAAASRERLRPARERRAACRTAAEARTLRRQGVDGDLGSALQRCANT